MNAIRLVVALVAVYFFWFVQNPGDAPVLFLIYLLAIVAEEYLLRAVRKSTRSMRRRRSPMASDPPGATDQQQQRDYGFTDVVAIAVQFTVVMLLADCVVFTDWLVLPAVEDGRGVEAVAKIAATVTCYVVIFAGPLAVAVFFYIWFVDAWEGRRPGGPPSDRVGCLALLPASVVLIAGYSHFYLAHLLYGALGFTT